MARQDTHLGEPCYLNQIGPHKLLSRELELALTTEVQAARKALAEIALLAVSAGAAANGIMNSSAPRHFL